MLRQDDVGSTGLARDVHVQIEGHGGDERNDEIKELSAQHGKDTEHMVAVCHHLAAWSPNPQVEVSPESLGPQNTTILGDRASLKR